jgi:hypothetical protein
MSKREALDWASRAPELMGLELRPFGDAADRFYRGRQPEPPGS